MKLKIPSETTIDGRAFNMPAGPGGHPVSCPRNVNRCNPTIGLLRSRGQGPPPPPTATAPPATAPPATPPPATPPPAASLSCVQDETAHPPGAVNPRFIEGGCCLKPGLPKNYIGYCKMFGGRTGGFYD